MKSSLKLILVLITCHMVGIVTNSQAQTGLPQPHEPCDTFTNGPRLRYLEYSLRYAPQHKQAYWVAYTLEAQELFLPAPIDRSEENLFNFDPNLKDIGKNDYRNSGYDRGHLSRANYNKRSAKAYEESFYMSNMSPQIGVSYNRSGGAWFRAEDFEEQLAKDYRVIYGVSGPVFEPPTSTINARKKITVPSTFYKVIIYLDSNNEWQGLGLLIPNKADANARPEQFKVPIRTIEQKTGLDFNCWMEKEEQERVEK